MKLKAFFIRTVAGMLLVSTHSAALAQQLMTIDAYCSYTGDSLEGQVYGFESDAEARAAVTRIVNYTGLVQNFEIYAANVPNAMATIQGQRRHILYNQDFMRRVRQQTNTDWAAISIMAHEVGHHLQGHTIIPGGSRPPTELEADRYSGYVLQRMGATIEQAQAAMQALGSEVGTDTHPAKSARLAAITNGWMAARDLPRPDPAPAPNPNPNPVPNPLPEPAPNPAPAGRDMNYVVRVVFPSDPVGYFVTASDDIVGVPPGRTPVIIGRRTPPTMPGFAWMYSTAAITYGVTPDGRVMSRSSFGVVFQIGYLAAP